MPEDPGKWGRTAVKSGAGFEIRSDGRCATITEERKWGRGQATSYIYRCSGVSFEFMLLHDDGDTGSYDKPEIDLDGLWRLPELEWRMLGDVGIRAIVEDVAQFFDSTWTFVEHKVKWRLPIILTSEQEEQRHKDQADGEKLLRKMKEGFGWKYGSFVDALLNFDVTETVNAMRKANEVLRKRMPSIRTALNGLPVKS